MDPISERLRARHPQRIDLSLDRMRALCAALGNPQDRLPPVVHVAGTNGKGSTVSLIRAIAEAAGLRVHPWTYRAENIFLPEAYRVPGDPATHGRMGQEIADAVAAGVDGFFTDYPLIGAQIRDKPY